MADKLCLRCDWTGSTSSGTCPRCGAPLYDHGGAVAPTRDRSWRGWTATALVIAVAAAAFVTVQLLTPSVAPTRPPVTAFQGYLLYPSPDAGQERLWIWDLAADTVRPGPALDHQPTALVSTYAVPDTWVGLTIPTGAGTSSASVLRSADADATPVGLGEGRFVAWPDGGALVSTLRTDAEGGCRTRLRVSTEVLSERVSAESLDRVVCGRAVGLSRDSSSPYVTIASHGIAIERVSGHRLTTILQGYVPLGVSINGDFLVRTPSGRSGMYYAGAGPPRPSMITLRGRPFIATRLLSWSTDAREAFVLGSIGGVRGVFSITVGPRPEPGAPSLVYGTSSTDVSASPTSTNDVFLFADGEARLVRDDVVEATLPLPAGAPQPQEPLLWVLSLPYSPSVTP